MGAYSIQDKTQENLVKPITNFDSFNIMQQLKQEQWAREDAIRKEVQEREDTAYQRSVKDMQKAGINPNLVGVNPAGSGGGITSSTGLDTSLLSEEMSKNLDLYLNEAKQDFEDYQGIWDRIMKVVNNVIGIFNIG